MRIPHTALAPATLRNLVEEFVTREGTDYGAEYSLDAKVAQVLRQLEAGKALIVYDPADGNCHIELLERLAPFVEDDIP